MKAARRPAGQAGPQKNAAAEPLEPGRNVAYWSIAAEIEPDGLVKALGDALAEATQTLTISKVAVEAVVAALDSIADALMEAGRPRADIASIQAAVAGLGQQMREVVAGATFQGFNLLDGSRDAAALRFVSGFDADSKPRFVQHDPASNDGDLSRRRRPSGTGGRGSHRYQTGFGRERRRSAESREGGPGRGFAIRFADQSGARSYRSSFKGRIFPKAAKRRSGLESEADMSAIRAQALETQSLLGAHRLPIANQNSHFLHGLPRSNSA